jgi:hypothetical protein
MTNLRALALDLPSVSAWNHIDEGSEAHRVFLGCDGYSDRAVLLIEDASLPVGLNTPSRVILVPWMIERLDRGSVHAAGGIRGLGAEQ